MQIKRTEEVKEEGELFERDEHGNLSRTYTRFLDGDFKEFDREGNLLHASTFVDGKLSGKYIGYHTDGTVWYKLNYVDGRIVN